MKKWMLSGAAMALAVCGMSLSAQVKPSALFGDHMVLQSGMDVPVWGTASPGEVVKIRIEEQSAQATAGPDGRWTAHLHSLKAGGPWTMHIEGKNKIDVQDVLVGEVWLATGQSNMVFTVSKKLYPWAGMKDEEKEIAAADYPKIRVFTMAARKSYEPQSDAQGEWKVCSPQTVADFSAVGYTFARQLQQRLNLPVGIVTVAYGGSTAEAWLPRPVIAADEQLRPRLEKFDAAVSFYKSHPAATTEDAPAAPATINAGAAKKGPMKDPVEDQHQPTVLFNGMLQAAVPYAVRGVLWYQGESIVGGKEGVALYPHTMETLVKQWRQLWGREDLPFLSVQLAGLKNVSNNPLVREQQAKILSLPHTGQAVALDLGDPTNVHPKDKAPLGERLARLALSDVYGWKIEGSGPRYASMQVDGSHIRIHFTHVGQGLEAHGDALHGLVIAGADQHFVEAEAKIEGDTIVVQSAQVAAPVAVRYAWENYPVTSNLYNHDGLPAAPFRTDAWDALGEVSQGFTGKN